MRCIDRLMGEGGGAQVTAGAPGQTWRIGGGGLVQGSTGHHPQKPPPVNTSDQSTPQLIELATIGTGAAVFIVVTSPRAKLIYISLW